MQLRQAELFLVAKLANECGIDIRFPALEDFAREFAAVTLRLRIEALGGVAELVEHGVCRIGVIGPLGDGCANLQRRAIGTVRLVLVAAPGHELAHATRPIPSAMVREHLQLVLTDPASLTEGQDFGGVCAADLAIGKISAQNALCC